MSALVPFSEALRLDAELVRLARGASAVRLSVGRALEALASSEGHYELGFSSLEAYARERCERTGRWAADTRALSRRLESLPSIHEALKSGVIGWSTAELLARNVTADSEVAWLEKARNVTVRELRALLADGAAGDIDDAESEPTHKLSVSATREDGWLFECARKTVEAVAGTLSSDELLQSLLAEGFSTLVELVPDCSALFEIDELEHAAAADSEAQSAWCAQRKRWRSEAEELCEQRWSVAPSEALTKSGSLSAAPKTPEALDREIRRLCLELSERDLALGIVAERARQAEVWRRLGFATEAQYARERLGVSLSSLKAKRILAARAARVPELGEALASGRVGYEAAYLLSRVVTPRTAEAWIVRAEMRTVKHLREEVEAAELLIRSGEPREQEPLDGESLDILFELERCIVSGDWVGRSRDSWAGEGTNREARGVGQMSGGAGRRVRNFARVTLRWNVTEGTYRFWRALERVFARVSTRVCREPMSFLRFLCENFCRIWLPALRKKPCEYHDVYRCDVFRCTSPVCTRRDVTPHHLLFRSHGGGDDDDNVSSLCVWCHLSGVHEGRITAEPPASNILWRIGRSGAFRIEGRDLTLR